MYIRIMTAHVRGEECTYEPVQPSTMLMPRSPYSLEPVVPAWRNLGSPRSSTRKQVPVFAPTFLDRLPLHHDQLIVLVY